MKSRVRAALAILVLLAAASAGAETVTIVGDPWCPYNCEPGGDRPGFGIEIAFSPANKRSAALARQLADGIALLEKTGRLREILAKYGVKP